MRLMMLAASLALAGMSAHALAQECDPNAILRSDVLAYTNDSRFFMSDVSSRLASQQKNDNTELGVTYKGVPMSLKDGHSLSNYLQEKTDYKMSMTESTSILRMTLSEASVKAYITCVGSRGVTVLIPPEALDEPEFPFTVTYHPLGTSDDERLVLTVTGGELVDPDKSKMRTNEQRIFHVRRDLTKTLFITATIAGLKDIVALPPKERYRVDFEEIVEPAPPAKALVIKRGEGDNTTDKVTRTVCITSTEGGLMGAKVIAAQVGGDKYSGYEIEKDSNTHRVCAKIWAYSGGADYATSISARLYVFRAVVVPLDEGGQPIVTSAGQ